MRSVVDLEINVARERLAALFADPGNSTKWMDDLQKYQPISGEPGMPGSTYRLVPKKGKMVLLATVISRKLPNEVRLKGQSETRTAGIWRRSSALRNRKRRTGYHMLNR